jgi:hypothetical protein
MTDAGKCWWPGGLSGGCAPLELRFLIRALDTADNQCKLVCRAVDRATAILAVTDVRLCAGVAPGGGGTAILAVIEARLRAAGAHRSAVMLSSRKKPRSVRTSPSGSASTLSVVKGPRAVA